MIIPLNILNFSLFLLAICLTIWNINQRYNTNKTTTFINHETLEEIVFPLIFSILINPGFDHSKLVEMGYSSDSNYILGVNRLGIPQKAGLDILKKAHLLEMFQVNFLKNTGSVKKGKIAKISG